MGIYSSPAETRDFLDKLGSNPFFVYDMDGNACIGYKLAEGRELPLAPTDNPKNQSIPFGLTRAQLDALVADGTLVENIFAGKTMDVRLPQPLVNFVNRCEEDGEPFKIAFLTSRSEFEAKKILQESGVQNVDAVTLIADSGAVLNIRGEQTILRPLTSAEEDYRSLMTLIAKSAQPEVDDIVRRHMGTDAPTPELYVEHKGIASNIHWRSILEANGQGDESALDHEIGAILRKRVIELSKSSPLENDKPVFKHLDGPATVELKIDSVNKGIGLSILMDAAAAHSNRPTAFVFSGDDYSKSNGQPGTDYFAAVQTDAISLKHGIPGYNVLTLHPKGSDINEIEPELSRTLDTLNPDYERPPVHLVVRTPRENGELVLKAHGQPLICERAPFAGKPDRAPIAAFS